MAIDKTGLERCGRLFRKFVPQNGNPVTCIGVAEDEEQFRDAAAEVGNFLREKDQNTVTPHSGGFLVDPLPPEVYTTARADGQTEMLAIQWPIGVDLDFDCVCNQAIAALPPDRAKSDAVILPAKAVPRAIEQLCCERLRAEAKTVL